MNQLPLKRSGETVTAFLSSLGSLRETRLTATLGFLVSRFPDEFLPVIADAKARLTSVLVEETEEGNRYDLLLQDDRRPIIIEAKLGLRQNPNQLLRYVKKVRKTYGRPRLVIVDVGSAKVQTWGEDYAKIKSLVDGPHFVTWTQIAGVCRRIVSLKKSFARDRIAASVAEDLEIHLEENGMSTSERPEIYLRDMSTTGTVRLYFRHCIYKCQPEYIRSARGNLYFAPYFTKRVKSTLEEDVLSPIGEGISYISRVKDVQVVERKQVRDYLRAQKIKDPKEAAELTLKHHRMPKILIMILGQPQLLFLSPITKSKLKGFGNGAMGARSCTLESLLNACHS
ncbi:MAG TPA: PD-(D/E)XK nuclease family protein [Verrucomicrobiae bacterium]|nr:PD-(D/E)XK nuclease family protein [Verrucomicrobiae bacterium]